MPSAARFPLALAVPVPGVHWDGLLAVDLFAPCGTPWLAVFDGEAVAQSRLPKGGWTVLLTADDGTEAYYAHGLPERASGRVRAGDVIGYVSDSGNAQGTGCHLHFAVGQINGQGAGTIAPWDWLGAIRQEPPPTQASDRLNLGLIAGIGLLVAALAAFVRATGGAR